MAEDTKFKFENGKFINRVSGEAIPDDEPVIIFRARDIHAIPVLREYLKLVNNDHHRSAVWTKIEEFIAFRRDHRERMKEPGITHDFNFSTRSNSISVALKEQLIQAVLHEARDKGADSPLDYGDADQIVSAVLRTLSTFTSFVG